MKTLKIFLSITLIIFALLGAFVYMRLIRVPTYSVYQHQKGYAHKRYLHVYNTPVARQTIAWDWVLAAFNKLYTRYPQKAYTDLDVLCWTGDAYFFSNRYDNAIKYYNKSLDRLKKEYLDVDWEGQGYSGEKLKNMKKSMYNELSYLNSRIMWSYVGKSNYAKAHEIVDTFIKMIDEKTKDFSVFERYSIIGDVKKAKATLYRRKGNFDKALEIYDELAQEFPKTTIIFELTMTKADTYRQKGDMQKAKSIYQGIVDKYGEKSAYTAEAIRAIKLLESQSQSHPAAK